jgi:uncharacterized membrane-anchored protein YhcB (DUF1043 family)
MQENGTSEGLSIPLDENGFIPGTSYKTFDDFVKGHSELKGKLDSQGNELGALRKIAELAQANVQNFNQRKEAPAKVEGPDLEGELGTIQQRIQELDPMEDNYQKELASLFAKSNKLAAKMAQDKTLSAAEQLLKKELSDRDARAAKQEFIRNNPSFETPEMQARIQDFLTKDKTGIHDPLSAFFQIQRDEIAAQTERIAAENAEMKKALDMAKGKDATGKVVVKGQTATPPKPQTILKGKDRDAAMADALAKLR